MKTLLISSDNPNLTNIGGKHVHLNLLDRGLTAENCEHTCIYPADVTKIVQSRKSLLINGIIKGEILQIISPEMRHFSAVIKSLKENLSEITINDYSIAHFHDVGALEAFNSVMKNVNIPKILTLHGYFAREFIDYARIYSKVEKLIFFDYCFKIEKKNTISANYIIAVDNRIKSYIIDKFNYNPNYISVIPNATDTDKFHPVSYLEKNRLRSLLGYNNNDLIVIVPRRLVPKNGVEYAIGAIKKIDNPSIKLIIIGDGILKDSLVKLSADDPRIFFTGPINHSEIVQFFQMSDVVLIPSITSNDIQEATSLSMLEGMSTGKVVICSNIGGMKEVIINNINGFLVKERSPDDIVLLFQKLIEEPEKREKIGINARKFIEENHSYLTHTRKICEIYSKFI